MKTIDLKALASVDPDSFYGAKESGRLLGGTDRACRGWCRAGKLPARRHPTDPRRLLIKGADILALAADLIGDAAPPGAGVETADERAARGRSELEAIRQLTKTKG